MKQVYILEMNSFTPDEAEEFLQETLSVKEYKGDQLIVTSHLTEKGVQDLNDHVVSMDGVPDSEPFSEEERAWRVIAEQYNQDAAYWEDVKNHYVNALKQSNK